MNELTDENFEREIQNADKPVLVDFFAEWCSPCNILTPILEKLAKDFEGKFILAKVNLESFPLVAQKFGIDRIPQVLFFKEGKLLNGFVGLQPESAIRKWLEENLEKGNGNSPVGEERFEKIIKEFEEYAGLNGFELNPNREAVERIIQGLLENEKKYGARYCPCRRISGDQAQDQSKVCPCVFHREEIEKNGHCLCGLFVK